MLYSGVHILVSKLKGSNTAALIIWTVAALGFAAVRIPYDDEWFSITLAADTDWSLFWESLRHDWHPPWIALLDRYLISVFHHRFSLNVVRIAGVVLGIALLSSVLKRQMFVAPIVCVLAAFHPVFFMYSGASRWYPVLFLAQALRAYGLWGSDRWNGRRALAYFGGAALGPAASYLDFRFLALDSLVLVYLSRKYKRIFSIALLLSMCGIFHVFLLAISPLGYHIRLENFSLYLELHRSSAFLGWLFLGMFGEAYLQFPWIAVAVAAVPGYGLAACVFVKGQTPRLFRFWVLSIALLWAFSTFVKVWHPRYSLILWLFLTTAVMSLFKKGRLFKTTAVANTMYLVLSLVLTVAGVGFLKQDLNDINSGTCEELGNRKPIDLLVIPYPRNAEQFTRTCKVDIPIVIARWIRHYQDENEQLDQLNVKIPNAGRVALVTTPVVESSLAITNARVTALMSKYCKELSSDRITPAPHFALKRILIPQTISHRFTISLWECGGPS